MPVTLEDLAVLSGANQDQAIPGVGDLAGLLGYSPATPEPIATPSEGAPSPEAIPAAQPVVQPSTASAPPLSPGAKTSAGVGAGVSVSGYSPQANEAIQKGPHTRLEKQIAGDRAAVQGEYATDLQTSQKAAEEAANAAIEKANLESQKQAVLAGGKKQIAEANRRFMDLEQAASDNAKTESEANIQQYRKALADYAAAKPDPSALWQAAGGVGQFEMIATAFAHDFLAAKGINTSGMESIKSAIQQNINAQLENMHKKLQVAQGFRELWTMQRAQSATDAEARQRMNGFYLSALSNSIEAQLGQYDSQLAVVQGKAAKAAIMNEQVKNDLAVKQHIDTAANQRATNRVQAYHAELQLSAAKISAEAHIKAAEIAAGKNMVSPLEGVIFDTSKSGQNVASRRFLPDVKPEERAKIREQTAKTVDTAQNIQMLIDLQDQISKVIPTGDVEILKRLQGEEKRVAELVRNVTKMGIIYDNSGKQINEQEVKLYDEIVGKKDWFLNGDNVRTLGTLAKMTLDKNKQILSAMSTEIGPGDPMYGIGSGSAQGFAKGESARADIESSPNAGRHVNTEVENQTKQALSPNATTRSAVEYTPFGDKPENEKRLENIYGNFKQAEAGNKLIPERPPVAFAAMDNLASMAARGDADAKAEIDRIANLPVGGPSKQRDPAQLLHLYAVWEKAYLENKPYETVLKETYK